ncbi:aldo/keto reductase [Rhizobium beringeri]
MVSAGRRRPRQARLAARYDRQKHNAAPSQIALAWVLRRSPVMLPIPGTSRSSISRKTSRPSTSPLSNEEFSALDAEGRSSSRLLDGRTHDCPVCASSCPSP